MNQYDLVAHLYRQRAFSRATFGPGDRTLGVTDHIAKELEEIKKARQEYISAIEDPQKHGNFCDDREREYYNEWVDVVLLALDGLWRAGVSPEEAVDLIRRKQNKNELRKWPDWRTADPNAAIQHVKE